MPIFAPRKCTTCREKFVPNSGPQKFCTSCRQIAYGRKGPAKCKSCDVMIEDRGHSARYCKTCRAERTKELRNASFKRAYNDPRRKRKLKRFARRNLTRWMSIPGNREALRARERARHLKLKLEAIARFGGKCACCGETKYQFLSLDHVDGDGAEHRRGYGLKSPASTRRPHFLRLLKRDGWKTKSKLQVLCMNCHIAIDLWGGCPHNEAEGFDVVT